MKEIFSLSLLELLLLIYRPNRICHCVCFRWNAKWRLYLRMKHLLTYWGYKIVILGYDIRNVKRLLQFYSTSFANNNSICNFSSEQSYRCRRHYIAYSFWKTWLVLSFILFLIYLKIVYNCWKISRKKIHFFFCSNVGICDHREISNLIISGVKDCIFEKWFWVYNETPVWWFYWIWISKVRVQNMNLNILDWKIKSRLYTLS